MRGSISIAILLEVAVGAWELLLLSLLALILTYLPEWIERNYKIELPIELEVGLIGFIYAAIFLGSELNFYNRFWWWDSLLHTFSGVALGFVGFLILYLLYYQKRLNARPLTLSLFAFSFSLAGGALWEIFEFSMDRIFGTNMQRGSLSDTMSDLIVDAAGALIVAALGYRYLKDKRGWLRRLIENFLADNPQLRYPQK